MTRTIAIATHKRETLVDLTAAVEEVVAESGISEGIATVYVRGATTARDNPERSSSRPSPPIVREGKKDPVFFWPIP